MFSLFMRYNFVLFNCQGASSPISHKGNGSINTISNLSKLIILYSTYELLYSIVDFYHWYKSIKSDVVDRFGTHSCINI